MVIIRLARAGAKKRPFYHVVVKHKLSRRDGGCIERLGYFNPVARGAENRLLLDMERINYWEGVGAQKSDRVSLLLKEFKKHGSRTGAEYTDQKPAKKKKVEAVTAEETTQEAPASEEQTAASEETPAEEPKTEEATATEETPAKDADSEKAE